MGREIVYCEGCGKRLTEKDFSRGKAQDHDNRPFCSTCRPVTAPPPPPQPSAAERRATERRNATGVRRRGATERIPLAQPPPPRGAARDLGGSRIALYVGGGLAGLVLIVVAVANHETPEHASPVTKAPLEHRPSPHEIAEQRLRELEAFAGPASDPQAVLTRCEQLRPSLRDTALETRLLKIEAEARERQKEHERAVELDRSLAVIRTIITEDPTYARHSEVEAQLESALKKAGPRHAEVEKLQSEYRQLWEEESKRREAAKKPVKPWAELFVQATNRVQTNDYPGAKTLYLEGLATLPERRPEDIAQRAVYCTGLYNLACICSVEASKLGDKARVQAVDDAVKYLDWALRSDYGRFRCPCHPQTFGLGHMADDKDLEALRADPRYAELARKYK
jgi:hypothetical protein